MIRRLLEGWVRKLAREEIATERRLGWVTSPPKIELASGAQPNMVEIERQVRAAIREHSRNGWLRERGR